MNVNNETTTKKSDNEVIVNSTDNKNTTLDSCNNSKITIDTVDNNYTTQIKKDKKAAIIFFTIMFLFGVGGGIIGFGVGRCFKKTNFLESLNTNWFNFQIQLANIMPYILCIFTILTSIILLILYLRFKKFILNINQDNELDIEKSDAKFNIFAIFSSVFSIISTILFGIMVFQTDFKNSPENSRTINEFFLLGCILFIAFSIYNALIIQASMKLIRTTNPEKTVSALDMKFKDKFINECDEAEQLLIYKSSYKAYTVTLNCCILGTLVCGILSMLINISIIPVISLGIISLISTITYMIEASKNS